MHSSFDWDYNALPAVSGLSVLVLDYFTRNVVLFPYYFDYMDYVIVNSTRTFSKILLIGSHHLNIRERVLKLMLDDSDEQ